MFSIKLYENLFGNKIILIFITLLCSNLLPAQVNIESVRKTELKEGLNGSVAINLKYATGNTEYIIFNPELRFDYFKKSYHMFILGSINRGEESKKIFIDEGFLHWRYILLYNTFIAPEFFTQIEYNDFIKLKNRNLAGTGIRFLSKEIEKKFNLYTGIGIMYEYEYYKDPEEGKKRLFRSTNYISVKWIIDERLLFNLIGYYQPSLKRISDFRVLVANSVIVSLSKLFSIKISVDYRFDNKPPSAIKKYDLGISNGLFLSF